MDDDLPDTRLFVSGLPPNFTEEDLGKHFAGRYQITDAQVIPGRRIGFVGFRNYTLAKNAITYFDKSYIRMSKIHVEFAKPPAQNENENNPRSIPVKVKSEAFLTTPTHVGETKFPTPNNDHKSSETAKSEQFKPYASALSSLNPLKRKVSPIEAQNKDRGQSTVLSRNSIAEDSEMAYLRKETQKRERQEKKEEKAERYHRHDVDDHPINAELEPTEKSNKKRKKKDRVRRVEKGSSERDREVGGDSLDEIVAQLPERESDADQLAKPSTDDEWLRSRTSRSLGLGEDDPASTMNQQSQSNSPSPDAIPTTSSCSTPDPQLNALESSTPDTDKFSSSNGRLFLRNLPFTSEEGEIESAFSKFGEIEEVHVMRDSKSEASKGLAYVQFKNPDSATDAIQSMDGRTFQGRLLHVLPASDRRSHSIDDYLLSKLPLKRQKTIKKISEASTVPMSWNSLYMNPDTVLASVAKRLGVSKSDILDPTASDAAVKQAHAETHIIQETKSYLSKNGVNLEALRSKNRRGTALLLKNLAYGTSADEIKTLFEPYGRVSRLIFPPSGALAVVDLTTAADAQQAARKLAYRNHRGSVLFLERAPENLFSGQLDNKPAPETVREEKELAMGIEKANTTGSPSFTLFIRNLNFATTSAGLTDFCRPMEGFLAATVKTKPSPKNPSQTLSIGYGFAEFRTAQNAESALKALNCASLDGHELLIRFAQRSLNAANDKEVTAQARTLHAPKTKIVIKNLPFETTKKDIRALFGPYGQLRSVRVPKKFDRSTRGFAFADFVSGKEAANAINALENTHLLGRRLVLEFASEEVTDPEQEIRAIEERVGKQIDAMELKKIKGSGRKKFNVVDE